MAESLNLYLLEAIARQATCHVCGVEDRPHGEFCSFDFDPRARVARSVLITLVRRLRLAEARAEASSLASIEARNPGIDMDEVRRLRGEVQS